MRESLLRWLGLGRDRVRRMRDAGDAARDARNWPAAAAAYSDYLRRRPEDWPIRVQLGHALKESADLSAAEASYRRAASQAPGDADVHLHLGHIFKLTGQFDQARTAYERSAELAPDGPAAAELLAMSPALQIAESECSLGDAARDRGEWSNASGHYRVHLRANPDDWPIWVQFGNMRKELGDFGGAEKAYHKAIDLDDAIADSHLQLGHVLKLAGRREEAIAAYERAASLDEDCDAQLELSVLGALPVQPEPAPVAAVLPAQLDIVLRARAARDQGQSDDAVALFQRYLCDHDDEGSIWLELAEVLRDAGRLHEAYAATERAETSLRESLPLLREQVLLLRRLGRIGACQALAMRIVSRTGLAELPEQLGLDMRL